MKASDIPQCLRQCVKWPRHQVGFGLDRNQDAVDGRNYNYSPKTPWVGGRPERVVGEEGQRLKNTGHLLFVIIQTDGTRQLLDSSKRSSCLSKSNGKSRRPPGAEKPRASRIRMMPWLERTRKVCDPPSRTRDSPRRFPVGPSEVAPGAGGTSTEVPFRGPRLFLATEHAIHGEQRRPGIQLCESHTVNVA